MADDQNSESFGPEKPDETRGAGGAADETYKQYGEEDAGARNDADRRMSRAKPKKLSTEPYKGVRDFYPEEMAVQNFMFATLRRVAERAGYVEYGASILEPSELYKSKGAANEEMVSEQTYTFEDRGGREVTLRPEMTPTVARMVAARRRDLGFPLRLYSIPNVFRYERPQKGRLREHWQLNVDLFGTRSPYADAEILGIAYGIMREFGAKESDFVIKVGSRAALDATFKEWGLNEAHAKAARALIDRRAKISVEEYEDALHEIVGRPATLVDEEPQDIKKMLEEFRAAGIGNIEYDPSIVRGFDYYTGLVFEVFDTDPANNRSLFGGGRYDNLTALFDDEVVPGVGFGMGDVTLREFLAARGLIPAYVPPTHVYVAITSPELAREARILAGELRRSGVNVAIDFGDKKLADQIRMADKHGIKRLIVLGADELSSGNIKVKNLDSGEETLLSRSQVAEFLLK